MCRISSELDKSILATDFVQRNFQLEDKKEAIAYKVNVICDIHNITDKESEDDLFRFKRLTPLKRAPTSAAFKKVQTRVNKIVIKIEKLIDDPVVNII